MTMYDKTVIGLIAMTTLNTFLFRKSHVSALFIIRYDLI